MRISFLVGLGVSLVILTVALLAGPGSNAASLVAGLLVAFGIAYLWADFSTSGLAFSLPVILACGLVFVMAVAGGGPPGG